MYLGTAAAAAAWRCCCRRAVTSGAVHAAPHEPWPQNPQGPRVHDQVMQVWDSLTVGDAGLHFIVPQCPRSPGTNIFSVIGI